jgi:hypothetical protein
MPWSFIADAGAALFADAGAAAVADAAVAVGTDAAVAGAADVAGSSFGGMLAGAAGSALGKQAIGALGTAGVNAITGTGGQQGTQAAQAAADPFASQRGQYQQQLQAMMQPGSTFQAQDPSYNFRLQQGEQAVNAGAAASGMLNSGNRLSALQTQGQNQASTEYQAQFSRLSGLAGAGVGSTGTAGQIAANANTQSNANNSAFGNQLASGIGNLFSNNSSATGNGIGVLSGDISDGSGYITY